MITSLEGKRILITGATGGLGTAVTRAFAAAGAQVTGVARSASSPSMIAADITTQEGTRALFDQAGDIDAVVHLVGGFAGGMTVDATGADTLQQMLDINLKSAFLVFSEALPRMRARGLGGALLAIGTRAAIDPQPMLGVYAASKAALVSLVQTIARENVANAITANIVLPGTMDTPANRKAMPDADPSKWTDPNDVAALLVHLASNRAVTGAVIPVGTS